MNLLNTSLTLVLEPKLSGIRLLQSLMKIFAFLKGFLRVIG